MSKDYSYKNLLNISGIPSFLITEFIGVFNENIFRICLILMAKNLILTEDSVIGHATYASLISLLFILPFLLFSGYAGYCSDAFNKKKVLVVTKTIEMVLMFFVFLAFPFNSIFLLLPLLFLKALQANFLVPTRYSIIPEIVPEPYLTRMNGLEQMGSMLAIICGSSIGAYLYYIWSGELTKVGAFLFVSSIIGWIFSLSVRTPTVPETHKTFFLNPWHEVREGFKKVKRKKVLKLSIVGTVWFWYIGGLLQAMLVFLGGEVLKLNDFHTGMLNAYIGIGLAIGSLLAGRISHDRIELGLIPAGSFGFAVGALYLSFSSTHLHSIFALIILGVSGGLFIVPLRALVQGRSPENFKGQILATSNFFEFFGIFAAFFTFPVLKDYMGLDVKQVVSLIAITTLLATVYSLYLLPDFFARFACWVIANTAYRYKTLGVENIPKRGPMLFVSNHISFIDWLFISAASERPVRFMLYNYWYHMKSINWIFKHLRAIPVYDGYKSIKSIQRARNALQRGEVVCIFAEGYLSRTGNSLPFKKGVEFITKNLNVPIIPVHLDGIWGSIFSFEKGRFFTKVPKKTPYPILVSFDKPVSTKASAYELQQLVSAMECNAYFERHQEKDVLPYKFAKQARKSWLKTCIVDGDKKVNYQQVLIKSILLSQYLYQRCSHKSLGILLPPGLDAVLVNIATNFLGHTAVNINPESTPETLNTIYKQSKIKSIIAYRKDILKFKKELPNAQFIDAERLIEKTKKNTWDKTIVSTLCSILPARLLWWVYGNISTTPHTPATIVFSNGSTGKPKGAILTHHNILSNIEGALQVFPYNKNDTLLGVLPFSHNFGYTATFWLPLLRGSRVVYSKEAENGKVIGTLVDQHKITCLFGTNHLYTSYLKECSPSQFNSLKFAMIGGSKTPKTLRENFKNKFGLSLLEGYFCAELGPFVSVNVPDAKDDMLEHIGKKSGSVGQPIPGVSIKITHPSTGVEVAPGEIGLIEVRSPALMQGYLGEKTLPENSWYNTGDIGYMDEDLFLYVEGRANRYSFIRKKIVSHQKLEETVLTLPGIDGVVVSTTLPDQKKLFVFYKSATITPKEVYDFIQNSELEKECKPLLKHILQVGSLPQKEEGDIDYTRVGTLAKKLAA